MSYKIEYGNTSLFLDYAETYSDVERRRKWHVNQFTLESIACYFVTFENIFGIRHKFTQYMKESCCLASNLHLSFKYFPMNAFIRIILTILSGLFWL